MSQPDKQTIRDMATQNLASLATESKRELSEKASTLLFSSTVWAESKSLFLFASIPSEPHTLLIAQTALACGKNIAYPRTLNSKGDMELRLVRDIHHLQPGRWKIPEPLESECPIITADQIDLALIPGLAFNRQGYRLGRGGGYYDRLLARENFHAATVGFFFSIQEVPDLPTEVHDQKMDWILTELELFKVI